MKAVHACDQDADSIAEEADRERNERLASRQERPKGTERRRRSGRRRRGRGHAADGSSAEVRLLNFVKGIHALLIAQHIEVLPFCMLAH